MFSPTERQSSLGHAPPEDPQSHYDLPVNSHIPGHYDLPPVRRPPSPRRTPQWLSERVSSSWLWGWIQARSRKKKEQTFSSPLTIRAAVRLLSHWGTVVYIGLPPPPFSTQHRPSVGQSGTRFTVTDLSSRQAVVRKAGLWRRQRGFSCAHLPWEKHSRRSLRLKAATWECSCVWTHPNGLQLKFSTYSACCRSAV